MGAHHFRKDRELKRGRERRRDDVSYDRDRRNHGDGNESGDRDRRRREDERHHENLYADEECEEKTQGKFLHADSNFVDDEERYAQCPAETSEQLIGRTENRQIPLGPESGCENGKQTFESTPNQYDRQNDLLLTEANDSSVYQAGNKQLEEEEQEEEANVDGFAVGSSKKIGNAEDDSKRQVVERDGNIDSAEKATSKYGEQLEVHKSEIIHQLSQLQAENEELLLERSHVDQQLDEKALRDALNIAMETQMQRDEPARPQAKDGGLGISSFQSVPDYKSSPDKGRVVLNRVP